jgi:hypothetical protein
MWFPLQTIRIVVGILLEVCIEMRRFLTLDTKFDNNSTHQKFLKGLGQEKRLKERKDLARKKGNFKKKWNRKPALLCMPKICLHISLDIESHANFQRRRSTIPGRYKTAPSLS